MPLRVIFMLLLAEAVAATSRTLAKASTTTAYSGSSSKKPYKKSSYKRPNSRSDSDDDEYEVPSGNKKMSGGAIAGLVVGVVVGVILIVVGYLIYRWFIKNRSAAKDAPEVAPEQNAAVAMKAVPKVDSSV